MGSHVALSGVRRDSATGTVFRAGRRIGLAAVIVVLGCNGLQTAAANGDTRTLTFHHTHTGENLTVTYRRNGRYDADALKKIDWVMRDWRRNQSVKMDPAVIDAVWELTRSVDGDTVDIICGYRAPATNSMLRSRSGGVAKESQHMVGKAIDLKVRGVSLEKQRAAALRLHRGGVGYYPGSQFIHVDTGSIRHWPRMTYDQLAKVFPDGRTVHVPSNGKPLPGYQQALAQIQSRGGSSTAMASLDAGSGLKPAKSLLASLFGGNDTDEAEGTARATTPAAATKPAAAKPSSPAPARLQTARAEPAKADPSKAEGAKSDDAKVEPKTRTARIETARPSAARVAAEPAAPPSATPEPAGPEMFSLASASSTPVRLAGAGDMPIASTAVAVLGSEPPRPRAEMGTTTASVDPMAPVGRERTPSRTGSLYAPNREATHDAAGRDTDRVPLELALAYASEPSRRPAADSPVRAAAMGSLVDRARLPADGAAPPSAPAPVQAALAPAPADGSPLAVVKKTAARMPTGRGADAPAGGARTASVDPDAISPGVAATATTAVVTVKPGMRFDDPWLRAVMLSPSLHSAMTVTAYGDPDYAELRSLMGKPVGSLVMGFGAEPYPGLASDRFGGGAVVFLATVSFRRTASLR